MNEVIGMQLNELIAKIAELNPNAKIMTEDIRYSPTAMEEIFSNIKAESLVLPEGFTYDDKNGITNKHSSATGEYISLKVQPLNVMHYPASPQQVWNSSLKYETIQQCKHIEHDFYSFVEEFERLNPTLKVNIADPRISSDAQSTIYFTRDKSATGKEKVVFPEGFSFDTQTHCATNKGNTKSGNYLDIEFVNTEKEKKVNPQLDKTFVSEQDKQKLYSTSPKLKSYYRDMIPDLSHTGDKVAIVYALQKLNPELEITIPDPATTISNDNRIMISKKPKNKFDQIVQNFIARHRGYQVRLPDGFNGNVNGFMLSNANNMGFALQYVSTREKQQCLSQEDLQKYFQQSIDLYNLRGINSQVRKRQSQMQRN